MLSGASSQARRTLPAYAPPLRGPARLDPSLELNQGDPPCSSPPWPCRAAGSDRFGLLELRVFSTFLNILRAICSDHGYPAQGAAKTSVHARGVSGCVNSAFSRHFYTFYGPSVQAMDTQLHALPILPVLLPVVGVVVGLVEGGPHGKGGARLAGEVDLRGAVQPLELNSKAGRTCQATG